MKKSLTLLTAALVSATALAQMKAPAGSVKVVPSSSKMPAVQTPADLSKARRIPRDEAMRLVKSGKAVYVDVRSRESFDTGHIKGALSIPESELIARIHEIPPGRMIITYCA
jgi:3-mercaptopyruvate sulfurtransferase SseA